MKTPADLADEHIFSRYGEGDFNEHNWLRSAQEIYLAGYKAAMDQVADASKAINSSNNSNGWISVKDRLPEINQGFIAFVQNKEVCNCHRYQNRSTDDTPIFYASTKKGLLICGLESVSHWQPLPEPPKEEK